MKELGDPEKIKELNIDGPILLPLVEDLPFLARPLTLKEEIIPMSRG
ncbi:MAG: hypothetical protein ACC628_14660 [Pirellulaceae bacterium]